jgi:hypothetical protein
MLEMNLDRRGPRTLLDTSIVEQRFATFGARVDLEYSLELFSTGSDGFRSMWLYGNVGLYSLADASRFGRATPGYRDLAQVPLDLTFDVGLRLDTMVGVFQIGFSTLLGFVAL